MKKTLILLLLCSTSVFAQTNSIYDYNPKYDKYGNGNNKSNVRSNNMSNITNNKSLNSSFIQNNNSNNNEEPCPIALELLDFNQKLRDNNDITKIVPLN